MLTIGEYPHTGLVLVCILIFFAMRLAVGIWASRQVSASTDYIVAGRRLPIYIAAASIMATWFAAETLMGAASTAYKSGFHGVVFDPFGAVVCLLISGLFFIRLMRRAPLFDGRRLFEKRYGREIEPASLSQLATYFAWTAAQFVSGWICCTNCSVGPWRLASLLSARLSPCIDVRRHARRYSSSTSFRCFSRRPVSRSCFGLC